jgi:hypothetical protein
MLRFFLIILLILLSINSNADVVYKCFSADGKVTLSDETCPSGMRSEALNIAPNVNQMKVMPDAPKPLKLPEKFPNKSTISPMVILPVAPIKIFPKQPPDDGLGDGYGVLSREYRSTKNGKPYWGDGLGDGYGVFSKEHRKHQQHLEKQQKYRDKHP